MKRAVIDGAVAAAAVCLCASILAQDLVDNPRYQDWSKYKPGTYIKMTSSSQVNGQQMQTAITTTLKELTPEKAVLETRSAVAIAGMPPQEQKNTVTEPAKIGKSEVKPASPAQAPNSKILGKGSETLKVGGKTYKCDWVESEVEQNGVKAVVKCWTCDDILDKVVRIDTKAGPITNSMVLTEFKAVK